MNIRNMLKTLNETEIMTIMACLNHANSGTKEELERFKNDYGEKTFNTLNKLCEKFWQK